MMMVKPIFLGLSLAAAGLALGGCQDKAADSTAVAQGSAPEGTISDELPDLELLPNDAPLARSAAGAGRDRQGCAHRTRARAGERCAAGCACTRSGRARARRVDRGVIST